jgi:hypothetical protein
MKSFVTLVASISLVSLSGAHASDVAGKINFKGTPPKAKKLKMTADAACVKANPGDVYEESVVTNDNGTLKNVFVYVKKGAEGKKFTAPTAPAVIDQHGCKYVPHVQGVMVGQSIEIRNSDPTLHNIHAMPKNSAQFNLGMPMKDMKMTRKFDKAEVMVKVKCDVHPWMSSYVGVLEHPYFGVSDDKGAVTLKDLPAGTYTVAAWHEKLGEQEQTVTVADGKPANVEFTFTSAEKADAAKAN